MNDVSVLLVSFDPKHDDDESILLVGTKRQGEIIDIINAFQGKEAREIYERLTTVKEKKHE